MQPVPSSAEPWGAKSVIPTSVVRVVGLEQERRGLLGAGVPLF